MNHQSLALLLIRRDLGDDAAAVAASLASRPRQTLSDVYRTVSSVPRPRIRDALLVLLTHACVVYRVPCTGKNKDSPVYLISIRDVLSRIRYPVFLEAAEELGPQELLIVKAMMQAGSARRAEVLAAAHELDAARFKPNQARNAWKRLVDRRFIVRACDTLGPSTLALPKDDALRAAAEREQSLQASRLAAASADDPWYRLGAQRFLCHLRTREISGYVTRRLDLDAGHVVTVLLDHFADCDPFYWNRMNESAEIDVMQRHHNVERYHEADDVIAWDEPPAKKRKSKRAAEEASRLAWRSRRWPRVGDLDLLIALEHGVSRVRLRSMLKTAGHTSAASKLPELLLRLVAEKILWENREANPPSPRTLHRAASRRDGDGDNDGDNDGDADGAGGGSGGGVGFGSSKQGDFIDGGVVVVESCALVLEMRRQEVISIVETIHGVTGARLFRILLDQKQLEHKALADVAMMQVKECRQMLFQLQDGNWVDAHPIPKSSDFAVTRTLYTWHVNWITVWRNVVDRLLLQLYNLHVRLAACTDVDSPTLVWEEPRTRCAAGLLAMVRRVDLCLALMLDM